MYNLYDPVTLANLCRTYGLRPSKQYGQNYLIEPEVIETILDIAAVREDETVVEVGPGFGVLTEALAPVAKRVFSFEIEQKLAGYWEKRRTHFPSLEIIWGNVLRQEAFFNGLNDYKVVANIPYQITSPLLRLFLEDLDRQPSTLTLLVQKEVGERICAAPGDLSVLGLMVQYRADPSYIATVPRTAFWPAPAVDSAIIHLSVKPKKDLLPQNEEKKLFELIKIGFSNRRKLLSKNLLPYVGKDRKADLENAFRTAGFLPTVRAQELSLEQWITLSRDMSPRD